MNLKEQTRWKTILDNGEYVIKGKVGQIAPYGDTELDVWVCDWSNTDRGMSYCHQRAARMETFGWKPKNHYDDGGLFIRPWADLDQACKFIKARRKRKMGEAQRLKVSERLAKWRLLNQTPKQEARITEG